MKINDILSEAPAVGSGPSAAQARSSEEVRQHKKPAIIINKLEIIEEEPVTVRKVVPLHYNHQEEFYLQSTV